MLAPKDRTLLLESLRPPPGYRLDAAVSTTFTLNLLALLVAPLAFTFFDWEQDTGEPTANPNALLEAIRRHADRINVFCQAGHIAVPPANRLLFSYLENSVHEVRPVRDGGVFHPKVWLVRYVADEGPVKYRLLCASRNLTFDRSWDTVLVLDGEALGESTRKNEKLSRFISALPGMAVRDLPETASNTLLDLADELDRVDFELPEHIDAIEFWPLGLGDSADSWPFPKSADRALVISPFLTDSALERLKIAEQRTLVSRGEEMDKLKPASLEGYELFTLSQAAELEPEEGDETESGPVTELSGLHAKLFACDIGGVGHLWTGSANATGAAFHNNVEFVVELRGKSKTMGVEAILAPQQQGVSVLRDLLEPFSPAAEAIDDAGARVLEQSLQRLRQFAVDLELAVHAEQTDEDLFDLELRPTRSPKAPGSQFDLQCWPLSLRQGSDARMLSLDNNWSVLFPSISFAALTTFFAFEGRVDIKGKKQVCRFMLNLEAHGFPDNRRQRLLRHLLNDRREVMRYLFLLLGDEGALSLASLGDSTRNADGSVAAGAGFQADLPMLEALVRALEHSPEKLDQVASLVDELSSTDEGKALLPEGFEQIWRPLRHAREALSGNGR